MKKLTIEFAIETFPGKKWHFIYITPDELMKKQQEYKKDKGVRILSYKQALDMAKRADKKIICGCGNDWIWQFGGCGICFGCTTGETDRSEDFELTMEPKKKPHWKGK